MVITTNHRSIGMTPAAIRTAKAEDEGYCPSNDFDLKQLQECIDLYNFYIRQLDKEGEYHTRLLIPAYQERIDLIASLTA